MQAILAVFQPAELDTDANGRGRGRGGRGGKGGKGRERGRGKVTAQLAEDLNETSIELMDFWIQTAGRYATETAAQIGLQRFGLFAK